MKEAGERGSGDKYRGIGKKQNEINEEGKKNAFPSPMSFPSWGGEGTTAIALVSGAPNLVFFCTSVSPPPSPFRQFCVSPFPFNLLLRGERTGRSHENRTAGKEEGKSKKKRGKEEENPTILQAFLPSQNLLLRSSSPLVVPRTSREFKERRTKWGGYRCRGGKKGRETGDDGRVK